MVYDYQLIWFHYHDPGYMFCAEVIHKNMKNLKVMGINGMNSCQVQRLFFPTAFPMITMAETLWNRDIDYDVLKHNYFTSAFGQDGPMLAALLERVGQPEITKIVPSVDALSWMETKGKKTLDLINKSQEAVDEVRALIARNIQDNTHSSAIMQSWKYLEYYPEFARLYLEVWRASYGECNVEKTKECYAKLVDYVNKNEHKLHRVFDGFMFQQRLNYFFKSMKDPGFMPDVE